MSTTDTPEATELIQAPEPTELVRFRWTLEILIGGLYLLGQRNKQRRRMQMSDATPSKVPIFAERVIGAFDMESNVLGQFSYITKEGVDGHAGMAINCPGCAQQGYLPLVCDGVDLPHINERDHQWRLSGTDDKPTLSPSIVSTGCCGWHGHLRDGVWRHV